MQKSARFFEVRLGNFKKWKLNFLPPIYLDRIEQKKVANFFQKNVYFY